MSSNIQGFGHGAHKLPDVGKKKQEIPNLAHHAKQLSKQVYVPKEVSKEVDFTATPSKTMTPEVVKTASKQLRPESSTTSEHLVVADPHAAMKRTILHKFERSAEQADPPYDATELCGYIQDALENPVIFNHFNEIFSPDRQPPINIIFDSTTHTAFYNNETKSIVLPTTGAPHDLLDALIFESCNAEVSHEFTKLAGAFYKSWPSTSTMKTKPGQTQVLPMPLPEYGRQMVAIESKSVFKHAQLAFALNQSGFALTEQANRNLISVLHIYLRAHNDLVDSTILKKSYAEQARYIKNNVDNLEKCFEERNKQQTFNRLVVSTANSPHNRNADPSDRLHLNSADLYAYEKLESFNPGAISAAILIELGKTLTLEPSEVIELQRTFAKWMRTYDSVEPKGMRVGVILDIIDRIAQEIDAKSGHHEKAIFIKQITSKLHLTQQIKPVAVSEKVANLNRLDQATRRTMDEEIDQFKQQVTTILARETPTEEEEQPRESE